MSDLTSINLSLKALDDRVSGLEHNGIPGVRDFFATSALSFLARESSGGLSYSDIAKKAYYISDAMMNERKKGQDANAVAK